MSPPKKRPTPAGTDAKKPSAIVAKVLEQLDTLRERRNVTQKAMMRASGGTQQQWSRWKQGAEPGLNDLCQVANVLDAELEIMVRDRRVARTRGGAEADVQSLAQVAEASFYFEELDEPYRDKLLQSVKRIAETYLAAQARNRATRAK